MEFWGVEVKSGESLLVTPGLDKVLHLSQACLGESKKDKGHDSVYLYVNLDGKKLVLGTLFSDKLPQQQFDLVFDQEFEISHNWKNGSVFFYGYKGYNPLNESDEEDYDSDEDSPLADADNGKPEMQIKQENPTAMKKANTAGKDSAAGKQKVKIVEPSKDVKPEEDEDGSDESDDQMSEDESESDEEVHGSGDSSDEEDDESDEDEETPKKAEPSSKKRPADSATKTPIPDKKAKVVTPQKTDGKKSGGHVATPHPAKQTGKAPANKGRQQTPKSAGSHPCKSCGKGFGSDKALDSHTKAKHK